MRSNKGGSELADDKSVEGEIVFCAHVWCMQVREALNQHAWLEEPQGLSGSVQVASHCKQRW